MKRIVCVLMFLISSMVSAQDVMYMEIYDTTAVWGVLEIEEYGAGYRLAGFEIPVDINVGTKAPATITFKVGRSSADSLQLLKIADADYSIALTDPTTGSYPVNPEYFYMWKFIQPVPSDTSGVDSVYIRWIFEPLMEN